MTVIKVCPNGPFLVEGAVKLVDLQGNTFPVVPNKPTIALCRCGHSADRPFCDGTHKAAGFKSEETASEP